MIIKDALLPINQYSRPGRTRSQILALCVHWTGVPNQPISEVTRYFINKAKGTTGYGSAHYGIDLDGTVYRWIPEDEVAYAVGTSAIDPVSGMIYTDTARLLFGKYATSASSPNFVTISVELTSINAEGEFTEKTILSAVELFADMAFRYKLDPIRNILRHYDIVGWKDCPRYFVRYPEEFYKFKQAISNKIRSMYEKPTEV